MMYHSATIHFFSDRQTDGWTGDHIMPIFDHNACITIS